MKRYLIEYPATGPNTTPNQTELIFIRVMDDGVKYMADNGYIELDYKSTYKEHIVGWGNGGPMIEYEFDVTNPEEFAEDGTWILTLWERVSVEEADELVTLVKFIGYLDSARLHIIERILHACLSSALDRFLEKKK